MTILPAICLTAAGWLLGLSTAHAWRTWRQYPRNPPRRSQ